MSEEKKLTPKQELFISEYLIDFNATRAAKAAGYSEDTAYSMGNQNLKKLEIKARIEDYIETVIADKNSILKTNIKFWQSLIFDDEASNSDKLKASEHLAKYAEMFKDKIELSGSIGLTPLKKWSEVRDGESTE